MLKPVVLFQLVARRIALTLCGREKAANVSGYSRFKPGELFREWSALTCLGKL